MTDRDLIKKIPLQRYNGRVVPQRFIRAAIIGHHLNGATLEEICFHSGVPPDIIKLLIHNYTTRAAIVSEFSKR